MNKKNENKNLKASKKPVLNNWVRTGIFFSFLAVFSVTYYLQVYAVLEDWGFTVSGDYTCDGVACPSTNIEVTGGVPPYNLVENNGATVNNTIGIQRM